MSPKFAKSVMFLLTLCFVAQAQAQIQVIHKGVAGGDCDPQTTSITMSPDNKSFSILYSDMQVQANQDTPLEVKKCYVDIDFAIPPNTQLEFVKVQYRGFMELLDAGTYGSLNNHHYFLNGATVYPNNTRQPGGTQIGGTLFSKYGPTSEEVFWEASFKVGDGQIKSISRCNGNPKLRIDTKMTINRFETGLGGLVGLDSADGDLLTTYEVTLKPCDKDNQRVEKICKKGTCYYFDPRTGQSIRP